MKKIENQIKQQIENREIPVSENAWDKLSEMMENKKSSKSESKKKISAKPWWMYAVAASVVILISVFVLNPFGEMEIDEPQIAIESVPNENTENSIPEKSEPKIGLNSEEIPTEIVKNEIVEPEKTKISTKFNSTKKEEFNIENKTEIAHNQKQNTEISEPKLDLKLPETEVPQEIASNQIPQEKPKAERKKSKYVDADMLLYSVENNQSISESRNNSKLVIIDFNK